MATGIYLDSDHTYRVTFPNNTSILTTVTASGDVVRNWIYQTLNSHSNDPLNQIAGLDVEWRPNFVAGAPRNKAALIQICVNNRCLVFQILNSDYIPDELTSFFVDQRFKFVGVGIHADATMLAQDYNLVVRNMVDLRVLAVEKMNRPEMRNKGLKALASSLMGIDIAKPRRITLSAWDSVSLSLRQIQYACADAFASYEVGRRLFFSNF